MPVALPLISIFVETYHDRGILPKGWSIGDIQINDDGPIHPIPPWEYLILSRQYSVFAFVVEIIQTQRS